MKPERQSDDLRLSAALHEWKVTASLPPRFQEGVWHRIAHTDEAKPLFWQTFAAWLDGAFRRPAMVFSYVALLLCVGITTGMWQVRDKSAQTQSQWRAAYVQSIDPYRMPRQ
jgi:hypothetical protein